MKNDLLDKDKADNICNLFVAMREICNRIIDEHDNSIRVKNLSNPKWGVELEYPDKKYQLILELKEVKK